jgi:hypothetical protein
MALNKLTDLNNHLFAQLERLGDESIDSVNIEYEVKRAKAITGIASQIIKNAKICIDAVKLAHEDKVNSNQISLLIGINNQN